MSPKLKMLARFFAAIATVLIFAQAARAQANLVPYQPSGWSDKLVLSKTTGTHTDDSGLTSTDHLYVDWSVWNSSNTDIPTTFYVTIYLDNAPLYNFPISGGLLAWYYYYYNDYSIGTVSPGTHTLKVTVDSTGVVGESSETDNTYIKTFTVSDPNAPNLTLNQPTGWSDKIVVSTVIGTNTDAGVYTTNDNLYLDWSELNNGGGAAGSYNTALYVDGTLTNTWTTGGLPMNTSTSVLDYSLGKLSAGTHTFRIVADSTGAITERDETDNQYTKTITVLDATKVTIQTMTTSAKPPIKNTPFNFTLSGYGFDSATVEVFALGPGCATPTSCVVPNSSLTTKTITTVAGSANLGDGTYSIQTRNTSTGALSNMKGLYVAAQSGTSAPRVLVLMVDFSDRVGVATRDFFQTMLFGDHPASAPQGSFRDFYKEISYQAFSPDGSVNDVTVAWIRLPQTANYYSNGCYGLGSDPSGRISCSTSYPQNAQKMVEDAVVAARAAGLDFGAFDANQDGLVDAMFVVHSGAGGEASSNPNDIWSHASATRTQVDTGSKNASGNEVYVSSYTTEPEYFYTAGDITMGVFAHEYGHTRFGLPDLYDIDYTSQGVGTWSLMAGGSWNGTPQGASPAHMDAWSKWASGFITPTKITSTAVNQPIRAASSYADVFQIRDGSAPLETGEYFLIENRQKSGFDSGLRSSGLLIWHIDEAEYGNWDEGYPGCTYCTGHYKVQLVQADNLWQLEKRLSSGDAGDPYPGVCGLGSCGTSFTPTSSPNSNLWNGSASGVSITSISSSAPTMYATISPVATTGPTVTINQASSQVDPTIVTPINFTVVFSEAVTGFTSGDVALSGVAGATTSTVTGSGTTYNVAVSGMTSPGTVIATIPAGVATGSTSLLLNQASTSTDNQVVYSAPSPAVTINQASSQADPATSAPINFTVVFTEAVTGFSSAGVTIAGTATYDTKSVVVTGSGTTYNVAVSGMTGAGTVIATVNAGAARGTGTGINNLASTSTDNVVTFSTTVKKRRGQVITQ